MELKHYLRILALRWHVVALPVLIVLGIVAYQELVRPVSWSTQVRASIIREIDPPLPTDYRYDGYYNYLASEFAIDDLVEAVRGNVFADAVAARLNADGVAISGGEVRGALAVSRNHRILNVSVSSAESERAAAIAAATEAELAENVFEYISVSADEPSAAVKIIQRPDPPGQATSQERLLMAMELLAALGIGVLLAFFVHYLDDRINDPETASLALKLPHLASLPAERH